MTPKFGSQLDTPKNRQYKRLQEKLDSMRKEPWTPPYHWTDLFWDAWNYTNPAMVLNQLEPNDIPPSEDGADQLWTYFQMAWSHAEERGEVVPTGDSYEDPPRSNNAPSNVSKRRIHV